jgi:hypothetical protein
MAIIYIDMRWSHLRDMGKNFNPTSGTGPKFEIDVCNQADNIGMDFLMIVVMQRLREIRYYCTSWVEMEDHDLPSSRRQINRRKFVHENSK